MIEVNAGQATTRQLRQFGSAIAVLCVFLAYWMLGEHGKAAIALVLVGLSSAGLAIFAPGRLRVPFVVATLVTAPIGWIISHLILGIIFFGVVTPTGLLLRLVGRRSMEVEIDEQAASYWEPRKPAEDDESYFRQS